jgi:hypothetical protein
MKKPPTRTKYQFIITQNTGSFNILQQFRQMNRCYDKRVSHCKTRQIYGTINLILKANQSAGRAPALFQERHRYGKSNEKKEQGARPFSIQEKAAELFPVRCADLL